MRYIRENGTMVAHFFEDIKNMLIKKKNALVTAASDELLNKPEAQEIEQIEAEDMPYENAQGAKCPWCKWECSSDARVDVIEHMKSCGAEDENMKLVEFEDDEDWFKIGQPPQDPASPIRALPPSYFLWHLPSDMGASMSLCGECGHTTTVINTLQAAVPSWDVCYECLACAPHRWVE